MPKEAPSGKSARSTTRLQAEQGSRMMNNLLNDVDKLVLESIQHSAIPQKYDVAGVSVPVPTDVGDLSYEVRTVVKCALDEDGIIRRDGMDVAAALRNHPQAMAVLFRHRLLKTAEWESDIKELIEFPESVGESGVSSLLRGLLEVEGGAGESFMYGNGRSVDFNPDARSSVESFLGGILGDKAESVVASRQPERIVDALLEHSGELRQLVEHGEIPRPLLAAMVGYVFHELSYDHAD